VKAVLIAGVLGALLASYPYSEAAAAPPIAPESVRIVGVDADGSGCPPGSVTAYITADRQVLGLTFREFDAQVGPGLAPSAGNSFCGVTVSLDYPAGWSYTLVSSTYRGRADLAPGVIGQQTSTYWFLGQTRQAEFNTTLFGPFFGPYTREDLIATSARVWSPCGVVRPLKIDADLSVSNTASPGARGFMNVKFQDISVVVTYGLTWRLC
jgi:Domain of unknown function (DUF4360)